VPKVYYIILKFFVHDFAQLYSTTPVPYALWGYLKSLNWIISRFIVYWVFVQSSKCTSKVKASSDNLIKPFLFVNVPLDK